MFGKISNLISNHAYKKGKTFVCDDIEYQVILEATEKYDGQVQVIGYSGRSEHLNIPSVCKKMNVITITNGAFDKCSSLKHLEISEGVKIIEEDAFRGCTSLESIKIPKSVKKVDCWSFCYPLADERRTKLYNVHEIAGNTFIKNNSTFVRVEKPSETSKRMDTTRVEKPSVSDKRLNSAKDVKPAESSKRSNSSQGESKKTGPRKFKKDGFEFTEITSNPPKAMLTKYAGPGGSVSVPASVEGYEVSVIGVSAFWRSNVESVSLPSGITGIEQNAFESCISLKTINLVFGITTIGASAFYGCKSLISVDIPESVKKIGDLAFYGCNSLKMIKISPEQLVASIHAFDRNFSRSDGSIILSLGDIIGNTYTSSGKYFVPCSPSVKGDDGQDRSQHMTADRQTDHRTNGSTPNFSGSVPKKAVNRNRYENGLEFVLFDETSKKASLKKCNSAEPVIQVPSSVSGYRVVSISRNAFAMCQNIEKVVIPEGVTEIAQGAFKGCGHLKNIEMPESLIMIGAHAFSSCGSLDSVHLPKNIKELDVSSFDYGFHHFNGAAISDVEKIAGHSYILKGGRFVQVVKTDKIEHKKASLGQTIDYEQLKFVITSLDPKEISLTGCTDRPTHVRIPEVVDGYAVTAVGDRAFNNCKTLASIEMPERLKQIGYGVFMGCSSLKKVNLPVNASLLGPHSFEGCSSLESVRIPDGLEKIEPYTFAGCIVLKSVSLPDSVKTIGSHAFFDCGSLSEIKLSAQLTEIGPYAFNRCAGLSSVKIPNGVRTIEESSFELCKSLAHVDLNGNLAAINDSAFRKCIVLKEIKMPDSVSHIGQYAFDGCISLSSINIPKNVKEIGGFTFRNCTSLATVHMSTGLMTIGQNAFDGCSKLDTVNIPASVTEIGWGAFSQCSSLKTLTLSEGLKEIHHMAFNGCISLSAFKMPKSVTEIKTDSFSHQFYGKDGKNLSTASMIAGKRYVLGNRGFIVQTDDTLFTVPDQKDVSDKIIMDSSFKYAVISIKPPEAKLIEYVGQSEKVVIPESASGYSITAIGKDTFKDISYIKNIKIPYTIKDIEPGTFAYKFFWGCTELDVCDIPGHSYVFNGECFAMVGADGRITVSTDSLGCQFEKEGLRYEITCLNPPEVCLVGYEVNDGIINIPSDVQGYKVTKVANHTFRGDNSIVSILFPDGVIDIGNFMMGNCMSLISVKLPGKLKSVGKSSFENCKSLCVISLPNSVNEIENDAFSNCESLKSIDLSKNITKLGKHAFYGCTSLESVVMPEGVTDIGDGAFENCRSLVRVNLPEAMTEIPSCLFNGCSSLESIHVPGGITKIGDWAFHNCSSLSALVIPETVIDIQFGAFQGCNALASINIPDNISTINENAFDCEFMDSNGKDLNEIKELAGHTYILKNNSYVVSDSDTNSNAAVIKQYVVGDEIKTNDITYAVISTSPNEVTLINYDGKCESLNIPLFVEGFKVTAIRYYAFSNCESLVNVYVPESVNNIGENAFEGCKSLKSIVISKNIKKINDYTFNFCCSLTTVIIPDGVLEIGDGAFSDCSSLTSVKIPNGIKEFGNGVFYGCHSLCSINIPKSIENINRAVFEDCRSLKSVVLPEGLTEISPYLFFGCKSLSSVKIPSSVKIIGEYAFNGCWALDNLVIPGSVTDIRAFAFTGCCLNSIDIPTCTKAIDKKAFAYDFFTSDENALIHPSDVSGHSYTLKGKRYVMDAEVSDNSDVKAEASCSVGDKLKSEGFLFEIKSTVPAEVVLTEYTGSSEEVTIPTSVEGFAVTSIGEDAFRRCGSLTSVTIPEGVISICDDAFHRCSNLKHVNIPSTVTALSDFAFDLHFLKRDGKTELSVNEVAGHSYNYFDDRKAFVEEVVSTAGIGVSDLESNGFTFRMVVDSGGEKTLEVTGYKGTDDSISIPAEVGTYPVTSIGDFAFRNTDTLINAEIPEGIISIGIGSFSGCSSLGDIRLPNSLKSIGDWAFYCCTSLLMIYLPSDLERIGTAAFYGCGSLASIDLPVNLKRSGKWVFFNCVSLTQATIPGLQSIGACAFFNCRSLSTVKIAEGVLKIEQEAFSGCESLRVIELPGSLQYISESTFDLQLYGRNGRVLETEMIKGHTFVLDNSKKRYVLMR